MRTIKSLRERALLALLVCVVAACSGGNTTTNPSIACTITGLVPAPPQMVYPASNATGVPDGNFTLKLSNTYGQSLELVAASGAVTPLTQQAGSFSWTVPALSAGTTYTIDGVFASPTSGCPNYTASVGTFTTQ